MEWSLCTISKEAECCIAYLLTQVCLMSYKRFLPQKCYNNLQVMNGSNQEENSDGSSYVLLVASSNKIIKLYKLLYFNFSIIE